MLRQKGVTDPGAVPGASTINILNQSVYDGGDTVSTWQRVLMGSTRQAIDVNEASKVNASNNEVYTLAA